MTNPQPDDVKKLLDEIQARADAAGTGKGPTKRTRTAIKSAARSGTPPTAGNAPPPPESAGAPPLVIHASAVPRLLACPQSRFAPAVRIDMPEPAADLGHAVHAVLREVVEKDLEAPPLPDGASDELRHLAWAGVKAWRTLRKSLVTLAVEKPLEWKPPDANVIFCGTPDVACYSVEDSMSVVIDWKSGYHEGDAFAQLKAYAWLVNGRLARCKLVVVWLRSGEIEVRDFSIDEMRSFAEDMKKALVSDVYSPSPDACRFCPRAHECPAKAELVREIGRELMPDVYRIARPETLLTPQLLAKLHSRAGMFRNTLDRYDAALREALAAHGPQSLGDGYVLALEERSRRTVALDKALPVLEAAFGPGALSSLTPDITVPTNALSKLARSRAEKGDKSRAVDALFDALDAAGAVRETAYSVVVRRKED